MASPMFSASTSNWLYSASMKTYIGYSDVETRNEAPRSIERQVLEAFIAQHYLGQAVPPLLVLSHAVDDALIDALAQQAGQRVRAVHQQSANSGSIWLDMASQGAGIALARLLAEEGSQRERTRALAEALDLGLADPECFRIECFDIQPHGRRGDTGRLRGL